MNLRISAAAFGTAIALTHCAPESMLSPVQEVPPQPVIPAGPETSFHSDPASSRLDYRDSRGEHSYKLSKLGTYSFISISPKRKTTDTHNGIWSYKQTGAKTGRLVFDLKDVWNITFTSPHRATAKKEGSNRSYTFEFEWL